ncbi:Response regulator receiver [Carbonactinospora thermoautotrophica]|uniref:Response regulator receiver n=1 Tax=Carbonactinospora thermoautotrophica TaxID=1469144 RepID=A0A132MM21_9ACTN|nr:ATP-binding protein [Carbonactinospora thermoautotrophica]KWW98769.1 Response regulator receiver [Carbonactinospora thermoautotrophica]
MTSLAPLRQELVFWVPDEADALHAAREQARLAATTAGLPEQTEAAALLLSELAANALRHAGGLAHVRLLCQPRMLRIEVTDPDPTPAELIRPAPDAEHGRGLHLVAALAHTWGCDRHEHGKTVWCELGAP